MTSTWSGSRLAAALARRARGPYGGTSRLEAGLARFERRLDELAARIELIESDAASGSRQLREDVRGALRGLAADERGNRSRVEEARGRDDYEQAWIEERPLVSVTVATLGRPELFTRSLPSILGQSHERLEVIVAGDGTSAELAAELGALDDSRVRFLDLGPRVAWTDDPAKLWLVGSTRARNAAVADARGRWVVEFDDDDALRPECLESLLDLARASRAEAVYGQVRQHAGSAPRDFCTFPPRLGRFTWAAGMYHAGLRFFGRELLAADLGLPGDWWLAERMLRAGVRFAMRDEVLCDAYASEREGAARREGRVPWEAPAGATRKHLAF